MNSDTIGRVVWHDLFSSDRRRAMEFYRRVAGWHYVTEHATDFAWGGGEKDFVLAMLGEEAGAGFAETPDALPDGWIAYVEVADVDASAALAETLGGTILREPFEVPGVGRNALLYDPLGAPIGLALSRHHYPAPTRQFGCEVYASGRTALPAEFYFGLFGWRPASSSVGKQGDMPIVGPSGVDVGRHLAGRSANGQALWIPSVKVADVERAMEQAMALGGQHSATMPSKRAEGCRVPLRDPDGVPICLADF